jgi:hypothetical protein
MTARTELRVRTFRLATGARLLSTAAGHEACPTLREALRGAPSEIDLVVNIDGLSDAEVLRAIAVLGTSTKSRHPGRVVVVCGDPQVRALFHLSDLADRLAVEPSLADALRLVVGSSWLGELGGQLDGRDQ